MILPSGLFPCTYSLLEVTFQVIFVTSCLICIVLHAHTHTHTHTHTARAQYQSCDPSSPCQETITAPPGSVIFNTNVEYVGGGSLGQIQLTRRLQLYRGERRLSNQVLYSCNNGDHQQIPCTDSLAGAVIQGDTQNKYDFSVQVQLGESDSGVYTAFVDVYDPIANSDDTLSKTFDVRISKFTQSCVASILCVIASL